MRQPHLFLQTLMSYSLRQSCRQAVTASFWVVLGFIAVTTTSTISPARAQDNNELPVPPNAKIVAGSVLTLVITDEPDLSAEYIVNDRGNIHFEISDDTGKNKVEWNVSVVGATADQAAQAVTESLKKYLRAPDVHLTITKMPHLKIQVSGPVRHNDLQLPLGSHLGDALKAAGCEPNTDYERVILLRRDKTSGKTVPLIVNFSNEGDGDSDPVLVPGDRIMLQQRPAVRPSTPLRTVRVRGMVGVEGEVPIGPKETIRDLLSQVGGLQEGADRKKVLVHRVTGKDYELDADKIEANDPIFNIPLEPGDFIIVGRRDLTQRYGVAGEVASSNVYTFDSSEHMTVLKAIEKAGGVTKKGDVHKGVLQRGYLINPLTSHNLVFDMEAIRKGKARDWELIPGDLIVIPPKQHQPSIWQSLIPLALHFLPFGL